MDREIDINEYLPLYLREYKELKYINNVFNTELSFLTEETEIIFNKQRRYYNYSTSPKINQAVAKNL